MSAMKANLHAAAELLGMHPDDLLDRLTSWGWHGDPRADKDGTSPRPMPEGLAMIAHWSSVHEGVNVELDVPDGLRVTIHYNDWLAVDQVAGR